MKRTIIFIIAALAVVLGILVVGNLLLIGEKIGAATHLYVEYAFYLLMAGLLAWFVIIPVARLLMMPEFPKLRTEDGWDVRRMRKFADSLAGNCFYIENAQERGEHRKVLLSSVSAAGEDVESLKKVITDEIDVRLRNINSLISRCGRKVFILTAASQNSTLDTLSVIVLNIRLIYNIVCATGYRPNIFQLTRIMAGVLGSAFTAYISQSLTNSLEGGLKNVFANAGVLIVGPLLGMLLNGSLNAALTLYVGYTTRNYVLKGPEALKNESDKAGVMSSAVTLASEYIKESFTAKKDAVVSKARSWVDKVVSWFTHKERVEQIPES